MALKPLVALALLATILAACSVAPESLASPDPSASPLALLPSATPTGSACPELPTEAPPPDPLPADLDEATRIAIEKRREYGLRRDIPWVRLVAADPRASTAFGIPLLPEEEESLFARNGLPDPVQAALSRYGHTAEFGGIYIDNALGGVVVVLWTGNVEAHAAAIRAELPPCHPVIFRQVRWSEAFLRDWQDRIGADLHWMAAIGAEPQGVGADITRGVVTIDVSSANPDVAALIVTHYGAPHGLLEVVSDGTGAALLPWGTVNGLVVTRDGKPPGDRAILGIFDAIGGDPGHCGGGDIGFGPLPDGTFKYPCQVGDRIIEIWDLGAGKDPHPIVGRARVVVPAGGEVFVRIVIDEPAQP
jgi:hypothetical protein